MLYKPESYIEISLDTSSIQPSTIVPLHKTLFCAYIFFSFLFFVFHFVIFILILLHAIRTLHCSSVGVKAFGFTILKKKKYKKYFFLLFYFVLGNVYYFDWPDPLLLVLSCI